MLIEKSFDMCLASSQLCNKFNQIGLLSLNLNALGLLLTLILMQFSGRVFCNLALLSCTILTKTLIGHTSMERTSKRISGRMSTTYTKKIEELLADFGNSRAMLSMENEIQMK